MITITVDHVGGYRFSRLEIEAMSIEEFPPVTSYKVTDEEGKSFIVVNHTVSEGLGSLIKKVVNEYYKDKGVCCEEEGVRP